MIRIEGNRFEGGGQIVRTALALSTITGIPFSVDNIRAGRPKPGLKMQHLNCISALKELCMAETENARLGSTGLSYAPGKITGKTLNIDIGTAGSITLLLQSLILPSMFADTEVRIKIKGGTDVKWASPVDYFSEIFLPHLNNLVKNIKFRLRQRGYYPKGQGLIDMIIEPRYRLADSVDFNEFLRKIRNEGKKISLYMQGELTQIKGISHASRELSKAQVAERQAKEAKQILSPLNCPIGIDTEYNETSSAGSGITLWALFTNKVILGSDSLGEKGKKSEEVVEEAAKKLNQFIESKAAVDPYLADQLIPFIALFGGEIKTSEITGHIRANAYVCNEFLGKVIEIDEQNRIVRSNF